MKLFYNSFYIIGQGFKGVFRNKVMTTASVLILIACMVLVGTSFLLVDTISYNFEAIDNLNVIEVMLDKDYDAAQKMEIGQKLAEICDESPIIDWSGDQWAHTGHKQYSESCEGCGFPASDTFRYVSADEHLEEMRKLSDDDWINAIFEFNESHSHDEGESDGSGEDIEDNPLRASYRIVFVNLSDISAVTQVKSKIDNITVNVEGVQTDAFATDDIKDNIELYSNVMSLKNTLNVVSLWLMAFFLLISLFVIMNTIKLGVSARENEITFMRLCGATKSFIRMPFIVEGVIIGIFSAIVSFGLEFWLYQYLLKDIISSAVGTGGGFMTKDFLVYAPWLALAFLVIGLFAGVVASGISMKKFLKK